jgi:hypothetical protein
VLTTAGHSSMFYATWLVFKYYSPFTSLDGFQLHFLRRVRNWKTFSNFETSEDSVNHSTGIPLPTGLKSTRTPITSKKYWLLLSVLGGGHWLWRVGGEPAARWWGLRHIIKHLLSYCGERRWPPSTAQPTLTSNKQRTLPSLPYWKSSHKLVTVT